jgi:hypothetical protein
MSSTEFNSVDDFLGHSTESGGRGGKFMKSWKKQGSVRVWLHTRRLPTAVWRHQIPQLTVFEDKKTRETVKAFWGRDCNCWEDETYLKQQYFRDSEDYIAPTKCAACRLIAKVLELVHAGELDWTSPVFNFTGATERKNNKILHAGGLTNMFGNKNLSREDLAQLKDAGIRRDEAWAENLHPKCQYVLALVNDDEVEKGVVIDSEPQSLGQRIKKAISDTQASLGKDEGNPFLNPYCIEFTYDEKAQMNDRYNARRIERVKMRPEIERLIVDEDPPDLTGALRPFNQATMRAFLEEYAVVDLPWDEIFKVPQLIPAGDSEEFPPTEDKPKSTANKTRAPARTEEPELPPKGSVTIPCDKCKFPMLETESVCRKCGAKYEMEDDDSDSASAEPESTPPPAKKGTVKGDALPFDGSRKGSRF